MEKQYLNDDLIMSIAANLDGPKVIVSDAACQGLSLEIRSHGEGSWRFRYSKEGKQKLLTLGDLKNTTINEARTMAFANNQALSAGSAESLLVTKSKKKRCPTFEVFVKDLYVPYIKTYKKSVITDLTILKNHILPEFALEPMNGVTQFRIIEFLHKKSEIYKPSYCNRILILLSFCFNLAIKWQVPGVLVNPCLHIKLFRVNNKIERFLSKEESIKLMDSIKSSSSYMLKYFVPLALLTGARKRELLDAKWDDVDIENRMIRFPVTKSGKPRTVPLTVDAITILLRLKMEVNELLKYSGDNNGWLFPNTNTGLPFQNIFNSWNTARKNAGLPDLRIHDLRHSFASALVNQGVSLYDVQKLLGHQSIHTTERYSHLSDERLHLSSSEANKYYEEVLL